MALSSFLTGLMRYFPRAKGRPKMNIIVVNLKFTPLHNAIYIGRKHYSKKHGLLEESPLANPFVIGRDGSRAEVLEKYKNWLLSQITQTSSPALQELLRLRNILLSAQTLTLACWCKPEACHGDILADILSRAR